MTSSYVQCQAQFTDYQAHTHFPNLPAVLRSTAALFLPPAGWSWHPQLSHGSNYPLPTPSEWSPTYILLTQTALSTGFNQQLSKTFTHMSTCISNLTRAQLNPLSSAWITKDHLLLLALSTGRCISSPSQCCLLSLDSTPSLYLPADILGRVPLCSNHTFFPKTLEKPHNFNKHLLSPLFYCTAYVLMAFSKDLYFFKFFFKTF